MCGDALLLYVVFRALLALDETRDRCSKLR